MKIQLLGTGSADGWPNAFCTCASCGSARTSGIVRGQTSALVDDRLLIDCGPEVPAAATRHGADLSNVRTLLVTHAHPDHVGPAALLFRHWAARSEPLDVYAPDGVLDQLHEWIGPDDPVALHPVSAGDDFECDGFTVRVLGCGSRRRHHRRSSPLRHHGIRRRTTALRNRHRTTLGRNRCCRGRRRLRRGAARGDVRRLPRAHAPNTSISRLSPTSCVGSGRSGPSTTAATSSRFTSRTTIRRIWQARLAPWGARVVPDGTVVRSGDCWSRAPSRTAPNFGPRRRSVRKVALRRVIVRSSRAASPTSPPHRRVRATTNGRPASPITAPAGQHTGRRSKPLTSPRCCSRQERGETVVVDCLTLWLTAVMDDAGAWDGDLSLVDKQIDALARGVEDDAGAGRRRQQRGRAGRRSGDPVRPTLPRHSRATERSSRTAQRRCRVHGCWPTNAAMTGEQPAFEERYLQ